MARLYANENFPYAVVCELRALGHDVVTVTEAGNAGQRIPDEAVLAYATETERSVLTINRRDFIRLHRQGIDHAGIIVCTQDADASGQAQRIHAACFNGRCIDQHVAPHRAPSIMILLLSTFAWRNWRKPGCRGGDERALARLLLSDAESIRRLLLIFAGVAAQYHAGGWAHT